MPQSLTRLYAHLVFSTKNREAFIDMEVRLRLHAYLATVVRELKSPWVVVGGVADHVHILFDMGKTVAPIEFVGQVKRESSKWIKSLGPQYRRFYWQRGYGMFSVSPRDRLEAEHYVCHQDEHHRQRTFQDEYRDMLTKYGIDFDERYVWD
jgi:REP element-mobilizing transposase RayT